MDEVKKSACYKLFDLWQNKTVAMIEYYERNEKSAKDEYEYYSMAYFNACELLTEIGLFTEFEIDQLEWEWRQSK